jgi:hypothetical protein
MTDRGSREEGFVVDSYMTASHAELLNHYFPENERDIAMRIVNNILSPDSPGQRARVMPASRRGKVAKRAFTRY